MNCLARLLESLWNLWMAAMLTLLLAPMSYWVNLRGAELARAIREMEEQVAGPARREKVGKG